MNTPALSRNRHHAPINFCLALLIGGAPLLSGCASLVRASQGAEEPQLQVQPAAPATPTAPQTNEQPADNATADPAAPAYWIGQSRYQPESMARFQLSYDRSLWQLDEIEGGDGLRHLALAGCSLRPTAGRGLADDLRHETERRQIGEAAFEITSVLRGDELLFTNYYTGGDYFSGFEVIPGTEAQDCLADAEAVLMTFEVIAAP